MRTLTYLVLLAGLGWILWTHRDRLRLHAAPARPPAQEATSLQEEINRTYVDRVCFLELGSNFTYHATDQRYRVEITVGEDCLPEARVLCREIAELIQRRSGRAASVFAFAPTGREVARCVL